MVSGQIYLGVVSNGALTGKLAAIGNVDKLSLAVSEDTKELLDYTSAGGGTQNKIIRIKSIDASITFRDISPDNLAIALRGTTAAVTSAAVTDEAHVAYKGGLVQFAFIPDRTQTLEVKDNAGTTTYVKDSDYTVVSNGVVVLSTGTIVDASTIKVSYTKKAAHTLEGLVNSGYDYRLVFDGLNEAQSGKPVSVTLYRVKFSPTAGLDLIGDDFNKMDMKGSVLQDSSITGTGLSQYIKIAMVD